MEQLDHFMATVSGRSYDFVFFTNEMANEFKKLASEKGYDNQTTIDAAFVTAMNVIAEMYADEIESDNRNMDEFLCGLDKAQQFIIDMAEIYKKA